MIFLTNHYTKQLKNSYGAGAVAGKKQGFAAHVLRVNKLDDILHVLF